jgi:CBS domain-containing protein
VTTGARAPVVRAAPPEALDDEPRAWTCADPLEPLVVPATLRAPTALAMMRRRGLDHVVVRDGTHQPRVVSETALLRRLAAAGPEDHARREPVGLVARAVPRLPADLPLGDAVAELFAADDDTALLVRDGEPVALLTAGSVLRAIGGRTATRRHRGAPGLVVGRSG